jgi:hypothetical protein
MRAPFFVEVLSRHKEVRSRHRVEMLPIRIGRSYDNGIILDDPHTSAHHAVIEQGADGGLTVRDLGSRNGIVHKGRRHPELPINGDTIFRIGHTSLRVRCADWPVTEEIADTTFHDWEGWPPALTGLVLITGVAVADIWLGDADKFEATRYLIVIAVTWSLAMLWCGTWSFANRLFEGNSRLGRHLFILGCGFAAIALWSAVSGALAYALSMEVFTRYGSHVVIAILAGMVFFHLLHIKPYRVRLFAATSIILALLGSGLMLMINYRSNGLLADELFMHDRLPPAMRLSRDKPISQFINEAARLKERVDGERTKPVNADEEESEEQD